MATWITHLRIAENLLNLFPEMDVAAFAVGNIAPDSGIPDEKWEKFTPPGEVTHFYAPKGTPYTIADLEFARRYLPGTEPPLDRKRSSFCWGYFCHLVTDNLWARDIYRPTRQRYQAQFDADRSFIWEVKKDWYGLDFEYVRDHPGSLYWSVFLQCEYPVNYLAFLLPEGVRQVIAHIQRYYRTLDEHALERINRQRQYLTMPEVDAFVSEATRFIHLVIQKLCSFPLSSKEMDLQKNWSVLEWSD